VTPLPPLPPAANVGDVLERVDTVVAWSIENASRLGYFAALYKRITRAIGVAADHGLFQDGARMQRLDAAFANRYFTALNGYVTPAGLPAPTHAWRVAFDAAALSDPIVVQHMLAGVNAHIALDLGIAAWDVVRPGPLAPLQTDFDAVNAVLADQVKTTLDEIDAISPVLADIYDLLQKDEIGLIDAALVRFRDDAWDFATILAAEPVLFDPATIMVRDLATAAFGALVFKPVPMGAAVVAAIAARESRDVAANIRVLDEIASRPLTVTATTVR
jgi:hypothetical protein